MLKPLTTNIKLKNIFAFDIETYDLDNKFLMGSIYGEHKSFRKDRNKMYHKVINKEFWSKTKFIEYIINNPLFFDNSYIVATNLGFDFLGLFGDTDILPEFNLIVRGGNIIEAKYKDKERKKTLKFIDTLNFSRMSVKNMGKVLGLPKLPEPICFRKKPKDQTEAIEMANYNKRDTRISFEYMKMLQKGFSNLGCNTKTTIASTSMDLFKRKYLKTILCQNKETIPILYKGYYGARVEVLKRGMVHDLRYYDYNSLYPSVMKEKEYPNPNYERYTKKCNHFLLENTKYEGLAKVTIQIKDIDLPYLPYRKHESKDIYKLIFPYGKFTGYYTFYELRKALKLGYEILEFGEAVYYTKTIKIFEDYVTDLYNKRLEYQKQKSELESVTKLNLNSLYGKFAQKINDREIIIHLDSLDESSLNKYINNPKKYKCIIKGNYIYVKNKLDDYVPSFILPIFSIYVTTYGRDKLYNEVNRIGVDNVYYYDTDSIVTDKILHTSDKLGELKEEFYIKNGFIIAPKMYYFNTPDGEVFKAKGIPSFHKFEEQERFKHFLHLLESKKIVYEKIVKFKEANNRNLNYNQSIMVEKNLNFMDTKRLWEHDFNINQLQKSKAIKVK